MFQSLRNGIRCTSTTTARLYSRSCESFLRVVEIAPPLGESITEGSVAQWIKVEGNRVEVDDVIVVVETDKVTVDVKSTRSGILLKRLAEDTVSNFRFAP